jgi:AcrR family transcriptional regulator
MLATAMEFRTDPAEIFPSPAGRPRGRPRAFDRDRALDAALRLFWTHGYEATPVSALTEAMGITPPQLYAAFGDKRRLFQAAVDRYQASAAALTDAALARPTAREAVAALLRGAARGLTDPTRPLGCFVVLGAVNCGPGSAEVEADLRRRRGAVEAAIRQRVERGAQAGELPPGTDAGALAKFYATVSQGMSVQARDGASAAELERAAEMAMAAWPG